MEFPTRRTMPPMTSGSTVVRSSTSAAGLASDLVADARRDRLVERDRARDLDRQEPVGLPPQAVDLAPDAEDHRHPVVLHEELEEVADRLVLAGDGAVEPGLLLLRREVRGEEEGLELAALLQRVGEPAELLADPVGRAALLGDLEERSRVDLGDLLHGLAASLPAGERREVELRQRLVDEAALVLLRQRAARHLLRGGDGEVGDLAADLGDRAPGLGLDVAAGLLEQLLAAAAGLLRRLALVDLGGLARADDDVVRLRARLAEALAVLLEELPGLRARALGRLDGLLDGPLALLQRRGDLRPRVLAQDEERDEERRAASRSSARRSGSRGSCCSPPRPPASGRVVSAAVID